MEKHIMAIHVNGRTEINPQVCKHERVVTIRTGHRYTVMGEAHDDCECYAQCLDCGWVLREDRTWGPHHQELKSSEIRY